MKTNMQPICHLGRVFRIQKRFCNFVPVFPVREGSVGGTCCKGTFSHFRCLKRVSVMYRFSFNTVSTCMGRCDSPGGR